jgi:hypothetical protein
MAVYNPRTSAAKVPQLPPVFRLAMLAVFAALGILLRQVALPTLLPFVTLTPGFTMPLLTGIALGPIEGLACGLVVGMSGGLTEPALLPILGNIALGLSTGIPSLARRRLPYPLWAGLCVVSGSVFGGFLPTFAVEGLLFLVQPFAAAAAALTDGLQAIVWAIVAVLLDKKAVQPLLHRLVGYGEEREMTRAQVKPWGNSSNRLPASASGSKD